MMYRTTGSGGCLISFIFGIVFLLLLSLFFRILWFLMPVLLIIAIGYGVYYLIMSFVSGGAPKRGAERRTRYDDSEGTATGQKQFGSKDVIDVEYTIIDDEESEK